MAWIEGNRFLTMSEMENNARIIWNYLGSKGWSINAVAGMLGNMQHESSINPKIWEALTVDYSRGYGLTQWTPATKLFNWVGTDNPTGEQELDRIIYESENELQWFYNGEVGESPPITFKEFTTSTEPLLHWQGTFFIFMSTLRTQSVSDRLGKQMVIIGTHF